MREVFLTQLVQLESGVLRAELIQQVLACGAVGAVGLGEDDYNNHHQFILA